MQRIIVTAILVLAAATPALAVDAESRVERAVVYPEGAQITRRAALTLPAGESTVRLVDLPPGLSARGIRIAVADAGVQLGQVRVEREPRAESYDDDFAAAERAVNEQRLVLQAIDDDNEAAEREITFLKGFAEGYARDAGVDGIRGSADPAAWRSALALLRDGTREARQRIRDNVGTRLAAERELSRRVNAMNALRGSSRQRSTAEVSVASAAPVATTLDISYFVSSAGWSPVYEARLDSDAGSLSLLQIGSVRQETDEDWRGIELVLSTSEPSGEFEAPVLDSELLSLYEPRARRKSAAMDEIVVTGTRVASVAAESLADIAYAPPTTVSIGAYAVDYTVPGRVDIANDAADDVTFELAATRSNVELLTTVVPLESTLAFLQSRFVYDGALPLFGGSLRVYVDGTFAGSSTMPPALPGSEITLPMGQDRRIDVSVRPQADENDRRGIINKRRYETTHNVYEITNRRPGATLVEVIDRYPVAEDRAIRVEVSKTASTPIETGYDDVPGLIRFERRLGAGETWRIRQQYTVSYPAGKELDK